MPRKPKDDELPEDDELVEEDAASADDDLAADDLLAADDELVEEDAAPTDDDLLAADDELVEEDAAPAADDLLADEDLADAAAPSLDDEPPLDDELAAEEDAAPPDDEEPAEADEPPEKIPAKVSILTIVMCLLNVAAVVGFLFLLTLDLQKRQAWTYYIFRYDLGEEGLPLEEESQAYSGFQATRAVSRIDADVIKREYDERKRKLFGSDFKGIGSDTFLPVYEVVGQRITPEQLSEDVLKDVFKEVGGEPVKTLQQEVDRVKKKLLPAIETAANETAQNAKTEADKRKMLGELLLPLAYTPNEIDLVDQKIKAAKAADLDRLLADAAQRKMLIDVLEPLEQVRPRSDEDRKVLETSADPDVPALDRLKKLLDQRFDQAAVKHEPGKGKENTWTQRSDIAYLLFTVGQLRKPDNQPLNAKAPERVEVVVGMQEYVRAAEDFALVLRKTQERMVRAVVADREGWSFTNNAGKVDKIGQFVSRYEEQIRQMLDLVALIKRQETQLATLQAVKEGHTTQYKDRKAHYDETVTKLINARQETARLVADLRRLEQQLFAAQTELANAHDTLLRMEQQARAKERPFLPRVLTPRRKQ